MALIDRKRDLMDEILKMDQENQKLRDKITTLMEKTKKFKQDTLSKEAAPESE